MFELKELNLNMGIDEYNMFQDIPKEESGSYNDCFGIPFSEFSDYLKKEIDRKNNEVTYDDTPTISYIMYVDGLPVGLICLRTKLDDNWMKWSGNFYYRVRKSCRNKGYGTKMLELALLEFKRMGYSVVYGQSSNGNDHSSKVIENNGGIFLRENNGTKYYKIIIE